jgi:hypothetical protein
MLPYADVCTQEAELVKEKRGGTPGAEEVVGKEWGSGGLLDSLNFRKEDAGSRTAEKVKRNADVC